MEGLRQEMQRSRRRLLRACPHATDAQVRRSYTETRRGMEAEWEAILFFGLKPRIGRGETVGEAEAIALAEAAVDAKVAARAAGAEGAAA